jgi:hypothetical protein
MQQIRSGLFRTIAGLLGAGALGWGCLASPNHQRSCSGEYGGKLSASICRLG